MSSKKEPKSAGRVALPPGSFNLSKLDNELSKTASIDDDEKRREAVSKALEKQDNGVGLATRDQGARPDQKRATRKREDLGTEEKVLVHNPKSDEAKVAAENAEADAEMLAKQQEKRAEALAPTPQQ